MVNAGIIGATGYTGMELLRLLITHPKVDSLLLTSRKNKGLSVSALYPEFQGVIDFKYEEPLPEILADCDVVFFCTPHGVAQSMAPALLELGVKVIDLSADFRIRDIFCPYRFFLKIISCLEILFATHYEYLPRELVQYFLDRLHLIHHKFR